MWRAVLRTSNWRSLVQKVRCWKGSCNQLLPVQSHRGPALRGNWFNTLVVAAWMFLVIFKQDILPLILHGLSDICSYSLELLNRETSVCFCLKVETHYIYWWAGHEGAVGVDNLPSPKSSSTCRSFWNYQGLKNDSRRNFDLLLTSLKEFR